MIHSSEALKRLDIENPIHTRAHSSPTRIRTARAHSPPARIRTARAYPPRTRIRTARAHSPRTCIGVGEFGAGDVSLLVLGFINWCHWSV